MLIELRNRFHQKGEQPFSSSLAETSSKRVKKEVPPGIEGLHRRDGIASTEMLSLRAVESELHRQQSQERTLGERSLQNRWEQFRAEALEPKYHNNDENVAKLYYGFLGGWAGFWGGIILGSIFFNLPGAVIGGVGGLIIGITVGQIARLHDED